MNFPDLPEPPFVAVIFPNLQNDDHAVEYGVMAERMVELASQQPGYLGINATRDSDGFGITVSYWQNLESARAWRSVAEHQVAQRLGREKWYARYQIQICQVESAASFEAEQS